MVSGPTMDLGPCVINFKAADLGATHGRVIFRYSEQDAPVYEDQLGVGEVDAILVGSRCEAEVPLTRMALANLSGLIAGATGSGTDMATGAMTVKSAVGTSRYDHAGELILKPVLLNGAANPDKTTWLHIFKASARPDFEIGYDNEGQRVYKVIFHGFPDQSGTGPKYQSWRIGPAVV